VAEAEGFHRKIRGGGDDLELRGGGVLGGHVVPFLF
jgi:hypothetical protein